jgi:hypothetical protein
MVIGALVEIRTDQIPNKILYGYRHAPPTQCPTDERRDCTNKTGEHFLFYRLLMHLYVRRN